MRDAVHMRIGEGARALEDDVDHLLEGQQVLRRAEALHGAARHELHDDVARVLANARVVDLRDMRVLELAGERRLGEEKLAEHPPAHRIAQRLGKNSLNGHLASTERVLAQKHFRGGAFAQLAQDRVVRDVVHLDA